jgi:hypothetical protein
MAEAAEIMKAVVDGKPADVKDAVEALVIRRARDMIQAKRAGEVIPKPANLADLGDSDLTKED